MDLKSLVSEIETEYPFIDLYVYETPYSIELANIKLPPEVRNQGIGTKIIQRLQQYAKEVQKPIVLTPEAERGKKKKLDKFYKNLDFVHNKGKNRDYRLSKTFAPTMLWKGFKEWLAETKLEWLSTFLPPPDDSLQIQLQNYKDGKGTAFPTYSLPKSRAKRLGKKELPCPLCKKVQPFPGQDTDFDQSNML